MSVWEGKNVEFRKMRLDEMDGISVWIAEWCARACVAEQGREISILSQLRTRVGVSSHLTPLRANYSTVEWATA